MNEFSGEPESLSAFIKQISSKLRYSDFKPIVDKKTLLSKFEEILKIDNSYWVLIVQGGPVDVYTNTIIIKPNCFDFNKQLRLIFSFESHQIGCRIVEGEIKPSDIYNEPPFEINYYESWLSLNYLREQLEIIIKDTLSMGNTAVSGHKKSLNDPR